jgi:alpha-1,3-mannosyltransferase
MSVLLYLPGLLVILVKQYGIIATLGKIGTVVFLQLLIGAPFILEDAKAYWSGAFDFSRSFLYKWTVNWRFMSEETFLDRRFAALLLILHAFVLLAFAAWKWTTPDGGPRAVIRRALQRPFAPAGMQPVTADRRCSITCQS